MADRTLELPTVTIIGTFVAERRTRSCVTMSGGPRSCMLQGAPTAMARPDLG
jgi:hypothetical protein